MNGAYQLDNIKITRAGKCIISIPKLIIERGQCIALLGANGSGKSTLLDVLSFISVPCHGSISLYGQPIGGKLNRQQRRMIGYVSQAPYLLSGTVADNIKLALRLQGINRQQQGRLTDRALTLVEATHLARQSASNLSGGEIKRVAIARAISYQPDIVLLDEPFSHLDKHHCHTLKAIIANLKKHGATLVISSHHALPGLALSDRYLRLVKHRDAPTMIEEG